MQKFYSRVLKSLAKPCNKKPSYEDGGDETTETVSILKCSVLHQSGIVMMSFEKCTGVRVKSTGKVRVPPNCIMTRHAGPLYNYFAVQIY